MFRSKFCDEINIQDYVLKDFKLIKLAEPTLEVVFKNKEPIYTEQNSNAQLRCKNLIWPFAKDGTKPIIVLSKQISKIVEATSEQRAKEVLELTLDTKHTCLEDFSPGDTVAILPHNNDTEVEFLLDVMQLNQIADQSCKVQTHPQNLKNIKIAHVPEETTPRELLRDLINIRTVPKKQLLRSLAHYCTAVYEADFLNCLASKEGSNFYNELVLEKGLQLCDLLSLCASCKPELSLLVEHLPRLLPRPYSIANSPLAQKHELKIIFSLRSESPGLTTNMLALKAKLNEPFNVIVYPRQLNNFRYTVDDFEKNQILIAIGTGVAPFLGFLEHKKCLVNLNNSTAGSTWLFMGAPTETAIPYRKRLLEYQDIGVLKYYFESLSRVSDVPFHYVQDQLIANAQQLIEFFMQTNTILYVCADGAEISKSIAACLITCLQQQLNLSLDEATELLKQFRLNGKFREDLWV